MSKKFSLPQSPIETKLGQGLEVLAQGIVDAANGPDVDLAVKLAALKTAGGFWAMKNKVQPADPEGSAFDNYGKNIQQQVEATGGDGSESGGGTDPDADPDLDDILGNIVQFDHGKPGKK